MNLIISYTSNSTKLKSLYTICPFGELSTSSSIHVLITASSPSSYSIFNTGVSNSFISNLNIWLSFCI